MRLAVALHKLPREIEELGINEIVELYAYDQYFDPLPQPWLQTGQVCNTMAQLWGNNKRRTSPIDFMPLKQFTRKEQSAKEQRAALEAWAAVSNARAKGRSEKAPKINTL